MTVNELQKEACVAMVAIWMTAFTAVAAPLPQPEFADAGACTNVALSALSASGVLSFSLSFAPGASNNVEVAFGTDLDGDGIIDQEPTVVYFDPAVNDWENVELTASIQL